MLSVKFVTIIVYPARTKRGNKQNAIIYKYMLAYMGSLMYSWAGMRKAADTMCLPTTMFGVECKR